MLNQYYLQFSDVYWSGFRVHHNSSNTNVCLHNQLNQYKETSYSRLLSSSVQPGNAVIWLKLPNPAEASAYIVQLGNVGSIFVSSWREQQKLLLSLLLPVVAEFARRARSTFLFYKQRPAIRSFSFALAQTHVRVTDTRCHLFIQAKG